MYSQKDLDDVKALLKKRWLIGALPAMLIFSVAIAVFVYGQLNRNDSLWIVTSVLTIVGGGSFLFYYGMFIRPASAYRKHLHHMLSGRKRETIGVFKELSEETVDRDGLEVRALLVNVGEKNLPEDDRLLYFDTHKPIPQIQVGSRVLVMSNDKMISDIKLA